MAISNLNFAVHHGGCFCEGRGEEEYEVPWNRQTALGKEKSPKVKIFLKICTVSGIAFHNRKLNKLQFHLYFAKWNYINNSMWCLLQGPVIKSNRSTPAFWRNNSSGTPPRWNFLQFRKHLQPSEWHTIIRAEPLCNASQLVESVMQMLKLTCTVYHDTNIPISQTNFCIVCIC